MESKSSLKKLLFFNNIIIVFVPLLIFFVFLYYFLTQSLEKEANKKNLLIAQAIAHHLENLFTEPFNAVEELKYNIEKEKLKPGYERINFLMESVYRNHPYFETLLFSDRTGKLKNIYPYNQDFLDFDISNQSFYREALKSDKIILTPVTVSFVTKAPSIVLAVSSKESVIVAYLELSAFKKLIERVLVTQKDDTIISDRTGTVLAHPNYQLVKEQFNMGGFEFVRTALEVGGGSYHYYQDGEKKLASTSIVPKTGWLVIYSQPMKEVLRPIGHIKAIVLVSGVTVVFLVFFLASLLSRRLVEPIVALTEKTKLFTQGDYSSNLQSQSYSYLEVSELTENFSKMIDAIKDREEALSFAKFAIDNASEAICWLDMDGKLLYSNKAFCNLIQMKKEKVQDSYLYDLDIGYTKDEFSTILEDIKKKGYLYIEKLLKKANGVHFPAEIAATLLNYEGKDYIFIFIRDISERKEAEEALFEEKELLSVTLRSIAEGVISTDKEGIVLLMNRTAEKLTGWSLEEAYGLPVDQLFRLQSLDFKGDSENLLTNLFGKEDLYQYGGKYKFIDRNNNEKIVFFNVSPVKDRDSKIIGAVLTLKDITDLVRLEAEILKSEKLEAVGILAGGIAHDFNNLLAGVLGNIQLAKMQLVAEHPAYKRIEAAEKALDRSVALTHQLLTFSKGGAPLKKASSIEEIVKDSAIFSVRGTNVRCEFDISDDLLPVEVDEVQLSRVISNLVINAVQAMPEGGTIKITVKNVDVKAKEGLPLQEGKYAFIEIKDQGVGIPEENLGKIFDPFYTTKKEGSGLGLAVVYSIIKHHGGYIGVSSKINEGTTFQIYLPSVDIKLSSIVEKAGDENFMKKGKAKILVMDDEEIVRDVAKELLSHLGYEAVLCKEGREAFEVYKDAKEKGEPFNAVIMDLTVPGGMGGKELMTLLLQYDPQVKAIVSSGYSSDPVMAMYKDFGFVGVIRKPFKLQELSELLYQIL